MPEDTRAIADAFDERAKDYSKSDWHQQYADRLVELAWLQPGQRVLDAGAGTGFAAIAIARRVGPSGHVVAVDISPGMLEQAWTAIDAAGTPGVELMQADATDLHPFAPATFDAVICSSAILYMPVEKALREWHRLLKPHGLVGLSTTRAGSPPAGRLFRECAAAFGVILGDPSAELGTPERCRTSLEASGFSNVTVVPGEIALSAADLAMAWASNLRSAAHGAVRALSPSDQDALRGAYELALRRAQEEDARSFARADVLYAFGRR
jgi:ubiquinone/menaquinone biosynthesis C-methylase UbiE